MDIISAVAGSLLSMLHKTENPQNFNDQKNCRRGNVRLYYPYCLELLRMLSRKKPGKAFPQKSLCGRYI
jgi:hypothetical protein